MLPKISENLYLQVASVDEIEAKKVYKARIGEISEQYIAMEIPLDESTGRLKRLYPGDELSAYFATDGGVKNYFNSSVLGFKEDVVRLVIIKKPEPDAITKVQRRSFLRVAAELEIAVKLTEQVQFLARTDDVGGGGISFFCEDHIPIKSKDTITCWLLLPYRNGSIEHANFKGEIVRIKEIQNEHLLVMVVFKEILDSERQKVIRFCFERQIDYRK